MARTRSAAAHQQVLDAALQLVAEHGIESTSMDAIARESGVSKATIYKHWADKEALLLEMLASVHRIDSRPRFDSGKTRADMVAVLSYRPDDDSGGNVRERLVPHLVAYSATHPAFGLAWRNVVMEPPRRELKRLLQQGIERGEIVRIDFELALALLLGPVLYWHVFLRKRAPEVAGLAEGVVNAFWRAFSRSQKTARR